MKQLKKSLFTLAIMSLISGMLSCGIDPPNGVASFENPTEKVSIDSISSNLEVSQTVENGDVWECKEKEVDISKNSEEFVLFSGDITETVFPGNLLQGAPLQNGELKIIPLDRGSGEIAISLLNGSEGTRRMVEEVNFEQVNEQINKIIKANEGTLSARLSFTKEVVQSEEEIGIALGVEYKKLGQGVKGSFSFTKKVNYNRIMVKLTQVFYDVVFSVPTSFEEVFANNVRQNDLDEYIYPGNPATYISSVSYGRIFYLLVESTETLDSMQAAIDATFAGGGGSLEGQYVKNLANSKVSGYALGGDTELAAGAAIGDIDRVNEFVTKGADIRTGVPISYKIRDLLDPSIEVKANVATKYIVSDCRNLTQGLPYFRDVYRNIGSAAFFPFNSGPKYKMALFDANTNTAKYISSTGGIDSRGAFALADLGNGKHPFRNTGVNAVAWSRADDRIYFFNKTGDRYVGYKHWDKTYGPVVMTKDWGGTDRHPFTKVSAAADGTVGSRHIVLFFSEDGTEYCLFEGSDFSTPTSIKNFRIRNSDEAVAIPFDGVGAALRLYIQEENENGVMVQSSKRILAIFNREGTQYVYYDLDKQLIIGPIDV